MIIDRKENIGLYKGLGQRIQKALMFIENTDLESLEPGRYDIDGEDVFALISQYQSKDPEQCQLEAHRNFIDVQYVIKGTEMIGYVPFTNQEASMEYNEADDFILYPATSSFTQMDEGMFAIFYPNDLHMPGTWNDVSSPVKKLVVKVRV